MKKKFKAGFYFNRNNCDCALTEDYLQPFLGLAVNYDASFSSEKCSSELLRRIEVYCI